MKNFTELRKAAGLADRNDFMLECGVSERSLVEYDTGKRNPPMILVKFLRLLANGCKLCPLAHRNYSTQHKTEEN